MSSTKKKVSIKTAEPKPLYEIDQIVYTISYHRGNPEELLQVKIRTRASKEIALRDLSGKRLATEKAFSYSVIKPNGFLEDIHEIQLYPATI